MLLGLQSLPIKLLRRRNWLDSEMRVRLNPKKTQQYAKEKASGSHFPAPVVFVGPDQIYRVGDGFHRIEADVINGLNKVEVLVKAGTLKEAILFNLKANRENQGLSFAPGDLTKSIKRLLTDKLFKGWSRYQISEAVGCSYSMVSRVALNIGLPRHKTGRRPQINWENVVYQRAAGKTYQEIANDLGVSRTCLTNAGIKNKFIDCPHCHGSGKILKAEHESSSA